MTATFPDVTAVTCGGDRRISVTKKLRRTLVHREMSLRVRQSGEVAVTVHGIGGNSGRQGRSLGGVAIQEIFFKALTVTAVGLKKKCGTIL